MQQNAFSNYDYNCPLYKTAGMMKCICKFFDCAKRAIVESTKSEKKISWGLISTSLENQFIELSQMKFKDPKLPEADMRRYFDNLSDEIETDFRKMILG